MRPKFEAKKKLWRQETKFWRQNENLDHILTSKQSYDAKKRFFDVKIKNIKHIYTSKINYDVKKRNTDVKNENIEHILGQNEIMASKLKDRIKKWDLNFDLQNNIKPYDASIVQKWISPVNFFHWCQKSKV